MTRMKHVINFQHCMVGNLSYFRIFSYLLLEIFTQQFPKFIELALLSSAENSLYLFLRLRITKASFRSRPVSIEI